jgi:uncharacterized membrane protein YozB (DUF420 family)
MVLNLPHVNASLNATAMVLLIAGYVLIRRRREVAHQRLMTGPLVVSALLLVCYLVALRLPVAPARGDLSLSPPAHKLPGAAGGRDLPSLE